MRTILTYTEDELIDYVKGTLIKNGGETPSLYFQKFRSRSEHCRRVMKWCEKIVLHEDWDHKDIKRVDMDVLLLSAAFHDIGYNSSGLPHEEYGCRLFERFTEQHPVEKTIVDQVLFNILHHSKGDRDTIPESDSIELIILKEADLLDEEGFMGIAAVCMMEGMMAAECGGYKGAARRIEKFAGEILTYSPMVTPYADRCWKEKQEEVRYFIKKYKESCFWDS